MKVILTLIATRGKEGRESVLRRFFFRYMYFPAAEGLSSFLEFALKRLPTATEADVKQVISAQLKYAPDRALGLWSQE